MRVGRRTLGGIVVVLVCGCSADFESRLDAYEAAVAKVAGPAMGASVGLDPTPPRRRHVRQPVDAPTIGVFDLLSIQGCRLGELAGYRNSQMGRVMPATRRLSYELEVLTAGQRCLPELEDTRRQRLQALLDEKRSELDRHVWNALWTTPELEALLAPTHAPLARRALGEAAGPLVRVRRQLESGLGTPEDAEEVESALAALRGTEPLGLPLRRLDRLARTLTQVAERVGGYGQRGCEPDEVRLASLFRTVYLQALQPDIATLDRNVAPVLDVLEALYQRSRGELPLDPAVVDYHERVASPTSTEGVWSRYREAMRIHAQAWAPTLRACDVLPDEA